MPLGHSRRSAPPWGAGDPYGRGRSAAFLNANGDAWLDLYVTNEIARSDDVDAGANSENKLFLGSGGTRFTRAGAFGLDRKIGNGEWVQAVDITRDGWTDIMVTGRHNVHLYRNKAGTGFTDISSSHGLYSTYLDADLADLDRDGDLDLVGVQKARLVKQINNGAGVFGPVQTVTSLTAGFRVEPGDADNDGQTELFVQQSSPGANPVDLLLLKRATGWVTVPAPATTGSGSNVEAVRLGPGQPDSFLVLNGRDISGPIQLLSLSTSTP